MSGVAAARWIALPNKADSRGTLTVIDQGAIPFSVARLFYVHAVPQGAERGGHAHRVTEQFFVALAGRFSLELTDGTSRMAFELDSPNRGVYVPPMIWDRLYGFSSDAVCLVAASTPYAESDYIRDWAAFLRMAGRPAGAGAA